MTTRIRISLREATAALIVAVAVAGCGGNGHRATPAPKLPATLAVELAQKSDEVGRKLSGGDSCGALASARELQAQATAAVGARQVPRPLQRPLLESTADLTRRIACTPPEKKPPKEHHDHHGKGKKH
jgi:hypothetical protein